MLKQPVHLRKSIIALLLRLQKADNQGDMREFAYIHKVATHLGMDKNEVRHVERSLQEYPLKPPSDEKERMTILYYLLFLMDIDGQISQEEVDLVKEFGLRLGFRLGLTTELINIVQSYAHRRTPPEALLHSIKKYLN